MPHRRLPVREVKLVHEVGLKVITLRGSSFINRKVYDRFAKDLNLLTERTLNTLRFAEAFDEYADADRSFYTVDDWLALEHPSV